MFSAIWNFFASFFTSLVGTDLRQKGLSLPTSKLHTILNSPFDPISAQVCVLEFGASWCPPCRAMVPKLAKLQNDCPYVPILQISSEDCTDFSTYYAQVQQELAIPYHVATVDQDVWDSFASTIGFWGIPYAIILKKGVIQWAGHPGSPSFITTVTTLNDEFENGRDIEAGEDGSTPLLG